MDKINLLLVLLFILASCSGFEDAGKVLRNEKVKTTDEFLIKKRDPLVLPPDYREMPKPRSKSDKKSEASKIKEILKVPEDGNISRGKPLSVEQSIIDKIKK
tara:strand:+ start:187 stop:492 length:306 start_codon:yes stop_codon:yes gene_type:complete